MISEERLLRLKRSALIGTKIAAFMAIMLLLGHVAILQVAVASAAVVLFCVMPSLMIIASDLAAASTLMQLRQSTILQETSRQQEKGTSRWLLIALIQTANAVLAFFLLLLSGGGDHAENILTRATIVIAIFLVITIAAFAFRGGRGTAFALLTVPLILLFAWRV